MSSGSTLKLLLLAGITVAAGASRVMAADDTEALLTARKCHACHAVSENRLGPSYVAIAAKHSVMRSDALVEVLSRKIVAGGGGAWGNVPMVPNDHVSLDEARRMTRWILERRPGN
ncbi:MAG: hypothetical protein H6978_16150 [Gammaproteobacteria bacterium]|nr:hypothetical protein [Gammaproteobacteria bacterium]